MFGSLLSFTFLPIEQNTCGMFNVLQTLCIRSLRMYNILLENVNESERDCLVAAAAAATEQNCVVK